MLILQDWLATGYTVDLVVAPDRVALVKGALERAGIDYQVSHTNIKE